MVTTPFFVVLVSGAVLIIMLVVVSSYPLLRRWRFVPMRGSKVSGFLLFSLMSVVPLSLYASLEMLVLSPARIQQHFFGEQIAGPLSLVRAEWGGFQDPYLVVRYRLAHELRRELAKSCLPARMPCTLFSGQDERWFGYARLESEILVIEDGLH